MSKYNFYSIFFYSRKQINLTEKILKENQAV